MKFKDAISNYLYDKKYFVSLYEDKIHLFGYKDLIKLTENSIKALFDSFILSIQGSNLSIIQMNKKELLIKGNIISVIKNEK